MNYPKLTNEPGAIALAGMIAAGQLSPLEAVDAAIARIEALDGPINAVVVRDFERARDRARALADQAPSERQPLFGVPMTVKESFDVAGLPSCWGLEKFAGTIAPEDARVVRLLKDAGAIILGKTNIPPDLSDWQSDNPVYGRTGNPHDTGRSPGGSSGGSAAAVASGMVPCEYGTDIGGSVRVPAHFCGVWTVKTSWGLVSKEGHDHPLMAGLGAHDGALSIAGPFARNAEDLELLLRLTAALPLREAARPLRDARVLALLDHPVSPMDDAVRAPIEAALEVLAAAGVQIARSSELVPDLDQQHRDYMRMLNIGMSRGGPAPDGTRATATDWFDLLDAQARNEAAWAALFEQFDYVLAPPAPILAFEHDATDIRDRKVTINGEVRSFVEVFAWAGLVTFPNLPATVLPIGHTAHLPCGLQVIGPRWGDLGTIGAAREIDVILGG